MDDLARFWGQVARGDPGACWLWIGRRYWDGYGEFAAGGRRFVAHRWLWQRLNGELPRHMQVCHRCDVRACVNPAHLFAGTALENERDKIAKGRRPSTAGERNPNARLSRADVDRMRAMREARASYAAIAQVFGVSYGAAREAVTGRGSWECYPPATPPPAHRLAALVCPKCGGPKQHGRCKPCRRAQWHAKWKHRRSGGPCPC